MKNSNKKNTRNIIAMVLSEILEKKQFMDSALLSIESYKNLDVRDRGFVRFVVAHTLRLLPSIDNVLSTMWKKPPPINAKNLLRSAIAQINLGLEQYAVVDETVSATPKSLKGFTNAILRNIPKDKILDLKPQTAKWLYDIWVKQYGKELADKILESSSKRAFLDITVKPEFNQKLDGLKITPYTFRYPVDTNVKDIEGFELGGFWVQDIASTLPCIAMGNINGKNVLDLCAAPGGKTFLLKMLDANVTSVDSSINRLKIMQENAKRLNYDCKIIHSEVLELEETNKYDCVLLDAPCSATGTIRRHPELPYVKSMADINQLSKTQLEMLNKSSSFVKNGGILVYSVCSMDKNEGEYVIDSFLSNNPNFSLKKIELPFDLGREINTDTLRTFPFDMEGMDGFFIAKLIKKS